MESVESGRAVLSAEVELSAGSGVVSAEIRALGAAISARLALIESRLISHAKPLLTVREVAETTGRSEYTVRRWVATGRLVAIRVEGTGPRGKLLIAREQLDRLVTAGLGQELASVTSQASSVAAVPAQRGGVSR